MIHVLTKIRRPDAKIVEGSSKHVSATVHEASERKGYIDYCIKPIAKGMKICGPAFTCQCAPEIIDEAARIAAEFAYQQTDARQDGRIKVITDSGTEIIKISPELREQIFEACQSVYSMVRQAVGDELVDAMLNARPQR